MELRIAPMIAHRPQLQGLAVFLSSSIPDPERWDGTFDVSEITDAVVSACRAVLTAGGTLVTAAHPTIAPLILYVAAEFPTEQGGPPRVITYQSSLFADVLPEATRRFREAGVGDFRFTHAVQGDEPVPERGTRSLQSMRRTMFDDTKPVAGIFVGGMTGIRDEYELLMARRPRPLAYAVARPGGEAAVLAQAIESSTSQVLRSSDVYPSMFRQVIDDIARHVELEDGGLIL
jgi:hypothetical protein